MSSLASVRFGYGGKWSPDGNAVCNAAYMVKSDPAPVGVQVFATPYGMNQPPYYRVVSQGEYYQAAQSGQLVWTA